MFGILILDRKLLIFVSLLAAILCGAFYPDLFGQIKFLGDLFVNLLKLFTLPLICSALVALMGNLSTNLTTIKHLSKKAFSYMVFSELMAVAIAITLFNIFHPGAGSNPDLILQGQAYQANDSPALEFSSFALSIFPDNLFAALANFELLPAVAFSILFGLGCTFAGETTQPIVQLAVAVREASTKCLYGVMQLAPIGIFALVGSGVAQAKAQGGVSDHFSTLLGFVAVVCLGLLLQGAWQLLAVVFLSRQKILRILSESLPVFSTALSTSSSLATLPVAMQAADQLNSKPHATKFMLPLSTSINFGGMMIYEMSAVLFFSEMLNIDLSITDQLLLTLVCAIGGISVGGIPETSMVSLVIVFKMVNIPLSAITLLLPLDRILDRLRTTVNVFGNMCGAIIVSHLISENQAIDSQAETPAGDPITPLALSQD